MLLHVQVADSPENEFGCQADKNNAAGNEDRKEDDTIPENYTCYEILMEAERNYDVTWNTGEDCFTCSYICMFCLSP